MILVDLIGIPPLKGTQYQAYMASYWRSAEETLNLGGNMDQEVHPKLNLFRLRVFLFPFTDLYMLKNRRENGNESR